MKKLNVALVALLFLVFVAHAEAGGVKTGGQKLTINGEFEVDALFRSEQFDNVFSNPAAADRSTDGFVDIEVTLDLTWQFSDHVEFFLELENGQTSSGNFGGSLGTFGSTGGIGVAAGGAQVAAPAWSTGSVHGIGGGMGDFGATEVTLSIEQAYLIIDELYNENLTFKVGFFDVNYDLRGNGSSWLFNFHERTGFTFGGFELNADFGNWFVTGTVGSLMDARLGGNSTSAPGAVRDMRRDTVELWILHGQYNFEDDKGLIYAQISNVRSDGNAFQMRSDFGDPAVMGSYDYAFTNVENNIYTLAFGADYHLNNWVELYGEVGFQFGEAGGSLPTNASVTGTPGGASATAFGSYPKSADAEGIAFYLGTNLHFDDKPWKPYIDVSFWFNSGDEDGGNRSDNDEGFQNWGDHNKSFIVENIDYGYGLNTNYNALKVAMGVSAPVGPDSTFENWNFNALFAWYQINSTDKYRNATDSELFPTVVTMANDADNNLGIEIDLSATYQFSENLTFTFGSGFLFSSDFIEDNYSSTEDGSARTAATNAVQEGEGSATLLFMDITLSF